MRCATIEDFGIYERMLRDYLLEQEMSGSPVLFTRKTLDWYRDLARSYLTGSYFGLIVLGEVPTEAGPEIAGFALAGEDMGHPRLDTRLGRVAAVWLTYVVPEHRKSGLGLAMLTYGWPFLRDLGFETGVLSIREDNQPAQQLALAYGVVPTERHYRVNLKEAPHGVRS